MQKNGRKKKAIKCNNESGINRHVGVAHTNYLSFTTNYINMYVGR